MSVLAKFTCTQVINPPAGEESHVIRLQPVIGYDEYGNSENTDFWKYTPAGNIELYTCNEQAAKQFEEGKEYYVTFEEVKKVEETLVS